MIDMERIKECKNGLENLSTCLGALETVPKHLVKEAMNYLIPDTISLLDKVIKGELVEVRKIVYPEKLPLNPNSTHCSQCGRDFYAFNNGYNKAIDDMSALNKDLTKEVEYD